MFSVPFISRDPVSHLSLSLFFLSTQSASPSIPFSRLHVCIWAHYGNGKATNSAFKMRQRFNEFLCCFMALRGLHGVMGFIWDLRATAENWKTSAFHGTMVLIVTALSPWHGLGMSNSWIKLFLLQFLDDVKNICCCCLVAEQAAVILKEMNTVLALISSTALAPRPKITS